MSAVNELYLNMPVSKQRKVRMAIMEGCDFSRKTFYRRLDNPKTITKPEQQVFAKILGVPVGELFPEKKKASPRMKKSVAK